MVHQHFMLVPVFTVAENVVLGVEPTGPFGRIERAEAERDVTEISTEYGLNVDPKALIESLPVGIQQRVEIIKVLFRDARIVVFDEPTAVLTPQEIEEFFRIVENLRDSGRGIVFITHKLKEALRIADRISVLRRGKTVGEADPKEIDEIRLAEMMVGRPVQLLVDKDAAEEGPETMSVEDLHVVDEGGRTLVDHVSFDVHAGEIVGIAGVQGNGQTELVEALTGLRQPLSGAIKVDGTDLTSAGPRQIHDAKIAHIPEDRQREGLVPDFSVAENMVLTGYHSEPFSTGVSHALGHGARACGRARRAVRRPHALDRHPGGEPLGRQPAEGDRRRELGRDLRMVIASQPTRGVDVDIHAQIVRAAREENSAVLVVSTELDEVMALADRVIVMYRGRIVADLDRGETDPLRGRPLHGRREGADAMSTVEDTADATPDEEPPKGLVRRAYDRIDTTNAIVLPFSRSSARSSSACSSSCCRMSRSCRRATGTGSGRPCWRHTRPCSKAPSSRCGASTRRSSRRHRFSSPAWRSPSPSRRGCSTSVPPARC